REPPLTEEGDAEPDPRPPEPAAAAREGVCRGEEPGERAQHERRVEEERAPEADEARREREERAGSEPDPVVEQERAEPPEDEAGGDAEPHAREPRAPGGDTEDLDRERRAYHSGTTNRLSQVELTSPPTMTRAIGCSISPPARPPSKRSGTSAMPVVSAVMRMGASRSAAPATNAGRSSAPPRSRSRWRKCATRTMPLRIVIPKTVTKPTIAPRESRP